MVIAIYRFLPFNLQVLKTIIKISENLFVKIWKIIQKNSFIPTKPDIIDEKEPQNEKETIEYLKSMKFI